MRKLFSFNMITLDGFFEGPNQDISWHNADDEFNEFAIEQTSGRLVWHFRPLTNGGRFLSTPTVGANGAIYVMSENGWLYVLRPDGNVRWSFQALIGSPFKLPPLVAADGTVYIAGENRQIFAVHDDGRLKYQFSTASQILAQPALSPAQKLFVATADRTLDVLNPDGSLHFQFRPPTGTFRTSPILSANGRQVYVAVQERTLYAVDTQTGVQRWAYTTDGEILSGPAVDSAGYIHLGNTNGRYVILTPEGKELSTFSGWLSITQPPALAAAGDVLINTGTSALQRLSLLPDYWDGRPDVQPTDSKKIWRFVNPVAVDIGADVLHRALLPNSTPITGRGVTVAVVDSGVYFTPEVKKELSAQLKRQFLGQADFVNKQCTTYITNDKFYTSGAQYDGYCFSDATQSRDGYGHGSHVAGIIWNNFLDYATGVNLGIAPQANILSVRVLDDKGVSSYTNLIQGIQYVVQQKDTFGIRVLNLSLSAYATTPYFVDPLNRAVEQAWAHGIVVVAAAGNMGPGASTVTVPGNDPYVITVGALDSKRTPGYWADDTLPQWSASGPTRDGFAQPDVVAPGAQIVSYMYNDHTNMANSAWLVQQHPDYSQTASLFRMNGTSMATAITSGVIALMLQANPNLTPDQVKYRLMHSARPALSADKSPVYSIFQQGRGRIWAPDAVLGTTFPADARANVGLDIQRDLAHICCQSWNDHDGDGLVEEGELDPAELAAHNQGPVRRTGLVDSNGQVVAYLYTVTDSSGREWVMGVARMIDGIWLDYETLKASGWTRTDRAGAWDTETTWSGGWPWSGGWTWSGGWSWSGGWTWSGGWSWSGGWTWSGGWSWSDGWTWSGSLELKASSASATHWVHDNGTVDVASSEPALTAAGQLSDEHETASTSAVERDNQLKILFLPLVRR
ncbi:MAG: hypothetical protein DCC55_37115 [Chloroflexi bacterium]|nr:MAG: hypothetical protein DCC55_37115 [Chloroflexota bacterium]